MSVTDPNCRAGDQEACEAILAYGECDCACHAEELRRIVRRATAGDMQRRAAAVRRANGIPDAGR